MACTRQSRRCARETAPFVRSPYARRLRCEQLEVRRLLALITVTTDQDVVDFNDGVTSLREAIFAANIVPGADEIQFDFGHDGPATILLTQGELQITDSLTIKGPGAELLTIDASGNDPTPDENNGDGSRVFVIDDASFSQIDVTFDFLTVTGGDVGDPNLAFGNGGGISSAENLQILRSKITDNFGKFGGGIYSTGKLSVSDSEFFNNSAINDGAGINATGGIVTIERSLFLDNSTPWRGGGIHLERTQFLVNSINLIDNTASGGAGISITDSRGSLLGGRIEGNRSTFFGAGIHIFSSTVTVSDSFISHNVAGSGGGGLSFARAGASSSLTVLRSTFVGNIAQGNGGGGLSISDGKAQIIDSSITGNETAHVGGGIQTAGTAFKIIRSTITGNTARLESPFGSGGGIAIQYASVSGRDNVLDLDNSIIAANSDPEGIAPDIAMMTTPSLMPRIKLSTQFSLIGDNSGTTLTEAPIGSPNANGNLIGGPINGMIDPLLAPLADNGGPTLTHALLPGSPALNMGDPNAVAGQNGVPLFDQRGAPFGRVAGGRIDIGAFEAGPLVVDTLVDENDGDYSKGDFSLREAIELANRIAGANTIEFDPIFAAIAGPLPATIRLTMGDLKITDSLTINGLGADLLVIDASQDQGSIFLVDDQSLNSQIEVTIRGLTLTGASNSAIRSVENLTVESSILRGNVGFNGGAISVNAGKGQALHAKLTVRNTSVVDNEATSSGASNGGGILFWGRSGELIVAGSTIQNNRAGFAGGGIAVMGFDNLVQISDSVIEGNQARDGGGIRISDDNANHASIERTFLLVNTAINSGGGIAISAKPVTIIDSIISDNRVTSPNSRSGGGGVWVSGGEALNIVASTISDNTSTSSGGGILLSKASAKILDSTISDNTAIGRGGGINSVSGMKLDIQGTAISGNSSGLFGGGGIYASGIFSTTGNAFSITDSTISNNSTLGSEGGIGTSASQMLVSNSTISGNQANGSGGGISLSRSPIETVVVHSTITNNTSDADNNGSGSGGGISGGPVSLDHTVVAGNHDNSGTAHDIAGVFNSIYSLVGFGAQFLGPLADNGGPTQTHALLPGSPALNAGDPTLVQGQAGLPEFDQRGAPFARVVGGRIDIGAYESQPAGGSLHADFDGDSDIDGRDFLIWQRGFGIGQVALLSDGDATGNQAVDENDLGVWQATYGSEVSPISSQLSAQDAAIESFANLSAGVPALFADRETAHYGSTLTESRIEVAEILGSPENQPELRRHERFFPPIYSSERPIDSDSPHGTLTEFTAALDEVFASL